jgi:regulator of sigma E protease
MDYVVGFLLLLGVLVFIHEFGHFYVAKLCGMKVEVFSIGMGKKILSWKRGETEYALSLFPLGGYVKILGQDPREEISANEAHRSFQKKPVAQKTAVVLAGPIANLLLAFFVFTLLFKVGVNSPAAQLVRVLPESPAAVAGFQDGDIVKSMELDNLKVKIRDLGELQEQLHKFVGKEVTLIVERDGQEKTFKYTPVLKSQRHPKLGIMQLRGSFDGVEYFAPASSVGIKNGSWASLQQIPHPIFIEQIKAQKDGVEKVWDLQSYSELQKAWSEAVNFQGKDIGNLSLTASIIESNAGNSNKTPESRNIAISWTSPSKAPPSNLSEAGFFPTEMLLTDVLADSPAQKAGLLKGDLLLSLNGKKLESFFNFRDQIQELSHAGQKINLSWDRNGEIITKDVSTQLITDSDPVTETKKQRFQIGAAFLSLKAPGAITVVKSDSIFEAISLGAHKTWDLTVTMLESFYHLAVGDISLKTLGSPIMIAKISGESIKQGWSSFVQMMAFISLNLFILNLMPIPVLDGGHLVLFAVESLIRRPLSVKVLEIWTTTGVVLLLMLMCVAFFNDFNRFGIFKLFSS